jgi:hypothetical protein
MWEPNFNPPHPRGASGVGSGKCISKLAAEKDGGHGAGRGARGGLEEMGELGG